MRRRCMAKSRANCRSRKTWHRSLEQMGLIAPAVAQDLGAAATIGLISSINMLIRTRADPGATLVITHKSLSVWERDAMRRKPLSSRLGIPHLCLGAEHMGHQYLVKDQACPPGGEAKGPYAGARCDQRDTRTKLPIRPSRRYVACAPWFARAYLQHQDRLPDRIVRYAQSEGGCATQYRLLSRRRPCGSEHW